MCCRRDRDLFNGCGCRDNCYYGYPNGYYGYPNGYYGYPNGYYGYPNGHDCRRHEHDDDVVVDVHVEAPRHERWY